MFDSLTEADIAICDDVPRIGTIDNATPAGEIFLLAWVFMETKSIKGGGFLFKIHVSNII